MPKVMTIIGTRPELIKMSRVIHEMDKHTQHILVHTGQNSDYELNQIFFDDLEIRKPDYFLEANCSHTINTIAKVLQETDKLLEKEQPDAVLIYGDTNSCLCIIAAKKRQIPIFHMEAGNRCFDQRVPEESNRKIVDHLSDINIVLSEHARRHLLAEGFPADRIIKSGSHMQEVLDYYMPKINDSTILSDLQLTPKKYFLVSAHREENVDSPQNIYDLLETLNCIATTYHMPIVVSTHPRTRMRLEKCETNHLDSRIQFLKPFGFTDYVKLQLNAKCILSDSGTITEEASLLSLPAITIRNAHERPEGMDVGTLIMSGLKAPNVLEAINVICATHTEKEYRKRVPDYDYGIVSKKILTIVLSYIPFVNRVVWSK
ncbi:non-hydrolyzing UDP-N-acetylglucosamine 2-epimerase [Candidatus Berkiella aquae]|uniref:UDP-2,3-diacetamido-2,3-dideoxy-D-glucuronate 2-epimerase n=1 Tax=Candidatus Berkiella aquae TaxID=295108 RepID=A0A0Q9YNH7_9GAMM|nr:UDP-N-acetylglucosamine 2-epimerase (non-hydrolyzing) [Candidatus Berkiella aquae]MCS5712442.1 UDP-N-acetylglucosamine 2-epimerase (non-hydrolyzing) [Candidatus Berkiella aquae]